MFKIVENHGSKQKNDRITAVSNFKNEFFKLKNQIKNIKCIIQVLKALKIGN